MAKSRGRKFAEITSPTSGVFDLTSVPTITNAKLQNSAMTLAGSSVSLGGTGVANTDALSEGSSNLYFTNARVQSFLGGGTLAGNIVVPDNRSIYLGSDSDFRMVHNTTNTQLINATGQLQITSNGGFAVTGAATFSSTVTGGNGTFTNLTIGATEKIRLDGAGGHTFIQESSNDTMVFATGGSTRLTLNADATFSGSVGLKATPMAWYANQALLQIGPQMTFHSETTNTTSQSAHMSLNAQLDTDGSWEYILSSNKASNYYQFQGTHNWRIAAAGTAGNDITWTNAMTIDNNGRVAIGTGSPSIATPLTVVYSNTSQFHIGGPQAGISNNVYFNGSAYTNRNTSAGGALLQIATDGSFAFRRATSGSSPTLNYSMYIDANGKVGIGSTNPSAGLMVQTSSDGTGLSGDDTNVAYFHNQEATTGRNYGVRVKAGSNAIDYAFRVDTLSTNNAFEVEGTGYVGIGASPNTTNYGGTFKYLGVNAGAGYAVIEGQTSSTTAGDGAVSFFASTTGTSGLNLLGGHQIYNYASSSSNAEGGIRWYTASGGNIPVRMTLDNSGNLGIGTSSPISLDGNANPGLTVSSNGPFILLQDANNSDKVRYISNNTGEFQFGIVNDNGATAKTEHMRITSGGKVGIGQNNPIAALSIKATSANTANHLLHVYRPDGVSHVGEPYSSILLQNQETTSGYEYDGMTVMSLKQAHYRFQVGNTGSWGGSGAKRWQLRVGYGNAIDQMSIYSWTAGGNNGGNEVVAWDTAGTQTNFVTGGNYVLRLKSNNGGPADLGIGPLNTTYYHFIIQNSTSNTFYFGQRCEASGGFHTYSDERLKKEITPISDALTKVKKMNGVTFKWIDPENRGSADAGKQFGVTAQNMLEVDSELPTLNKDPLYNVKEDVSENDEYYTMDYSRITPFLIEAIKEQQAQIEALQAEVKALKGE